jgi:transposase
MSNNNNTFEMPCITTVSPGAVPVITMLCRTAKIGEIVNQMVQWDEDRSEISPGLLIESLIVCIFCGRKPLWRVEEFWAKQDLKLLFNGVDVTVDQLNDDAYGRALDKLSEVKMEELVNLCSMVMLTAHDLNISTIHLDTTSKSVQGAYENGDFGDFLITQGHTKDHRPDLKQFKIGAAVQENGQPVMGHIFSGNTSDKVWNPKAALKMFEFFDKKGYQDIVFVSDCAIVSKDSISELSDKHIQFISRLPETFNLAQELKDTAWESVDWNDIGSFNNTKKAASYKTFAAQREINDRKYKFIVVYSSVLDAKKEKTLKKRITKQKEELTKIAKELAKQSFACIPDAEAALNKLQTNAEEMGFTTQSEIELEEKRSYSGKGRPRKGEKPTISITYHCQCQIGELKPDYYEHLRQKESTFVLIANVKDKRKWDDRSILQEYKNQSSIENKFRFLKSPVYLGPVYLEKPNRVQALGYVFILVLLISSYLEYRVRKSLKENNEYVLLPGKKKTDRPTTKTIMEYFSFIVVLIINGQQRCFPSNCYQQALNLVRWAGYNPEETYLKPLPWYLGRDK